MKKMIIVLLLISFSAILFSQEEVKLKDGRIIIINTNGTWKLKQKSSSTNNENSLNNKEAIFGRQSIWYNITKYFRQTCPEKYIGDVNHTGELTSFDAQITKFEDVVQFSDTEASCIFYIKYVSLNECKAIFKKTIDGKWLLNSIKGVRISPDVPARFHSWLNAEPNIPME